MSGKKQEDLFTLRWLLCIVLPPLSISSLISQKKLCNACSCGCVCVSVYITGGFLIPEKLTGDVPLSLVISPPKTVGLLPVHLLRLNQPQSATYFLKCLQSWLTVRVTLSVCVFDVCECLYLSFCCLIMSLSSNAFPLQFLTVAKPFHDHAEGLIQFLQTVFNLFSVFFLSSISGSNGPIRGLIMQHNEVKKYSYTVYIDRTVMQHRNV